MVTTQFLTVLHLLAVVAVVVGLNPVGMAVRAVGQDLV